MESSPTITKGGTIYIGSGREARFYALNRDGTEKWRFQTEVGISGTPAVGSDGTVYVGAWDSNFYAINPDGSEKWHYKTPDAFEGIISSPAIGSDGTIYVGSNSGNFYAFNPDGTVKWHYENKGSGFVTNPAIGSDGTIYAGTVNNKFFAFSGPEEIIEDNETYGNVSEENITIENVTQPINNITEEDNDFIDVMPRMDITQDDIAEKSFFERIMDWFKSLFG